MDFRTPSCPIIPVWFAINLSWYSLPKINAWANLHSQRTCSKVNSYSTEHNSAFIDFPMRSELRSFSINLVTVWRMDFSDGVTIAVYIYIYTCTEIVSSIWMSEQNFICNFTSWRNPVLFGVSVTLHFETILRWSLICSVVFWQILCPTWPFLSLSHLQWRFLSVY